MSHSRRAFACGLAQHSHPSTTHFNRSATAVSQLRRSSLYPSSSTTMIGVAALLYQTYSILAQPYRLLCPRQRTRSYTTATTTTSSASSAPPLPPRPSTNHTSSSNSTSAAASSASGSSIDAAEVSKFSAMSHTWWDTNGEFCLLHRMNPTRLQFIRSHTTASLLPASRSLSVVGEGVWPLRGLDVLDVGCGGGLLSESLCRLGGRVVGVDASAPNIAIATQHALLDPAFAASVSAPSSASATSSGSSASLVYRCETAEQLLASSNPPPQFDVVCSLEVVEHVANPQQFIQTLTSLVRPGGLLFVSTINRTALSWALTIGLAEYALGWVSRGTHEWHKYVTVEELSGWVVGGGGAGMEVLGVNGMLYDPIWRRWGLNEQQTDVNYILCARKRMLQPSNSDGISQ